MALYLFHLRNDDGVAEPVDHDLPDDLEAFKVAEALSSDFDVEVVQGDRFVAHVMRGSVAAKQQKFAA